LSNELGNGDMTFPSADMAARSLPLPAQGWQARALTQG
jgi:hypothetical protein